MPEDTPTQAQVQDALAALESAPEMTRDERATVVRDVLRPYSSAAESRVALQALLEELTASVRDLARRPTWGEALSDPKVLALLTTLVTGILAIVGAIVGVS